MKEPTADQIDAGAAALIEAYPMLTDDYTPTWFLNAAAVVLRAVARLEEETLARTDLAYAWAEARRAVYILEAEPEDPGHGYTEDEVAGQYAATDRLVAAFKTIDQIVHSTTE